MATLKMQVRAREGRVRQLENVVRALCSAYKVPLPPATTAGATAGEGGNGTATAAPDPVAMQNDGETNRNGGQLMEQEGEREEELVKNLFAGEDGGELDEDMVVDEDALDMDNGGGRARKEMWVHQ